MHVWPLNIKSCVDKNNFVLTFNIESGKKYYFNNINLNVTDNYAKENLVILDNLQRAYISIKNDTSLKNNKDLFQLFKIKEDINHINNKEFSYSDDIDYLRELLMFENLTSNPSKVDNKKYLDRLLLI